MELAFPSNSEGNKENINVEGKTLTIKVNLCRQSLYSLFYFLILKKLSKEGFSVNKNIFINLVSAISIITTSLIYIPVQAQNNQSDITGTNIFTNPTPINNQSDVTGTNIFDNSSPINDRFNITGSNIFNENLSSLLNNNKLNPEIISKADELAQKLSDAYNTCRDNQECTEFNNLLQQSQNFLSQLNQQVESVTKNRLNRTW